MGAEKKEGVVVKSFIQNPLYISKIPLYKKVKMEFTGKNCGQKVKKGGTGVKFWAAIKKISPPLAKKGCHPEKRA